MLWTFIFLSLSGNVCKLILNICLGEEFLYHMVEICFTYCMCAQSLSCIWHFVTPMDYSPSSSSVHGIFQARILDWVAKSSSWSLQESNLWLLHWQVDSLAPCPLGSPFYLLETSKFFCKMILLMYTPTSSLQKTHCSTTYRELSIICHFHTGCYEILSCCGFI